MSKTISGAPTLILPARLEPGFGVGPALHDDQLLPSIERSLEVIGAHLRLCNPADGRAHGRCAQRWSGTPIRIEGVAKAARQPGGANPERKTGIAVERLVELRASIGQPIDLIFAVAGVRFIFRRAIKFSRCRRTTPDL